MHMDVESIESYGPHLPVNNSGKMLAADGLLSIALMHGNCFRFTFLFCNYNFFLHLFNAKIQHSQVIDER